MTTADTFRAAIEAGDFDAATALFADDIRLDSPVKYRPFEGGEAVCALFAVLQRTFRDFRYVGQFAGRDADGVDGPERDAHLLHFRTEVDGKSVDGIDLLHLDDDGRIASITVMIRPMSAVQAVGEAIYRGLIADGVIPAATG